MWGERGANRGAFSLLPARALVLALAPLCAWSQSYPAKPVRLIVPFSPGANAEIIPRLVAQHLTPLWGQQMVLDNRPGGATNIGAELVAKAPADGYTLLLGSPPNAINMTLFAKLPYDTLRDFVPVVLCTGIPNVMTIQRVVRPDGAGRYSSGDRR